jgi:hypothetical protein
MKGLLEHHDHTSTSERWNSSPRQPPPPLSDDLSPTTSQRYRKTIHAVITPIEEASVETSLSHGMMSDSSIHLDPSPALVSSYGGGGGGTHPRSSLKKVRSDSHDLSSTATTVSATATAPDAALVVASAAPSNNSEQFFLQSQSGGPTEVRFLDTDTTTHHGARGLSRSGTGGRGGPFRSSSKRTPPGTPSRVSRAIQNIQEILLAANLTAKKTAPPLVTRAETTRALQKTNSQRKQNFVTRVKEEREECVRKVRGEKSLLLVETEVHGVSALTGQGGGGVGATQQSQEAEEGETEEVEREAIHEQGVGGVSGTKKATAPSVLIKFQSLQTHNVLSEESLETGAAAVVAAATAAAALTEHLQVHAKALTGNCSGPNSGTAAAVIGTPGAPRLHRGFIQQSRGGVDGGSRGTLPVMRLDEFYSQFALPPGSDGATDSHLHVQALALAHKIQSSHRSDPPPPFLEGMVMGRALGGGGANTAPGGGGTESERSWNGENSIPVYMRRRSQGVINSARDSSAPVGGGGGGGSNLVLSSHRTTSSTDEGENTHREILTEEDETLLKAYAAVLGLDWYGDGGADGAHPTVGGSGDVAQLGLESGLEQREEWLQDQHRDRESLQSIVQSLQQIRQTTPVTPHCDTEFGAEASSTLLLPTHHSSTTTSGGGRLSAPKPPKPLARNLRQNYILDTASAGTTSARTEDRSISGGCGGPGAPPEILHLDSDVSSCDDSTSLNSLPSSSPLITSFSRQFEQERELEEDLRDYLRSYDTDQGAAAAGGGGRGVTTVTCRATGGGLHRPHPIGSMSKKPPQQHGKGREREQQEQQRKGLIMSHSTSAAEVVRAARNDLLLLSSTPSAPQLHTSLKHHQVISSKRTRGWSGGGAGTVDQRLPSLASNKIELNPLTPTPSPGETATGRGQRRGHPVMSSTIG